MKYFIATYGCQSNETDAERIATRLNKQGHKKTLSIKEAGIVVINACSVRQSAIDRVYSKINQCKKLKKRIILTGCLLEPDKKKLKNKVEQIWHPDEYFDLAPDYSNPFSAHVPIMTGCDNFCTYCAVPFTRGRDRSRPAKNIIREVKKLTEQDYKEIWLLGQNVNSYHSGKINFPKLLQEINKIHGKFWVRFTSPHPKDFSDELIKTIAKCEKITKYINLPVQSGDNEILKKMNRNYTRSQYMKLVSKIIKAVPDIAISTDTIVGFPGETRKQFKNTADLYKKLKFDMAFIAEYSQRAGTAAALTMKDNVTHKEKEKRKEALTKILRKTALENNKKLVGKTLKILIDSKKDNRFFGRTEGNKLCEIKNPTANIGEFINVKITEAGPWKLTAEPAKNKIIVVLGPTASGKSDLAVRLAKKFEGEVISADSRQVYKEMDIGTDKITKRERKGIKHYLLDIASPKKIFTAMDFKEHAEKAIKKILNKEKLPIVCGGSGFYIHALLCNSNIPKVKPDWGLRQKLEKKSTEQLFKMLKKLDAQRAKNIDAKNKRRLVRAIEIALKPNNPKIKKQENEYDILWLGIKRDPKTLKKPIDKRVNKMIKNGLEKEVKKLTKKYGWTKVLKNTIGYREWLEDKPIGKIKLHTIQYTKNQMTWFKKYAPQTHWVRDEKEAFRLVVGFIT